MNKITCKRCGQSISTNRMYRHGPICDRIPRPPELRAEFRAGVSLRALARKYSAGITTMRDRLLLIFDIGEFKALVKQYHNANLIAGRKWEVDSSDVPHCNCGILMYQDEDKISPYVNKRDRRRMVDDGSGRCGFCQDDENGTTYENAAIETRRSWPSLWPREA